MIALYLLASHLVGDFVFQTRWQADGKLESRELRTQHVFFYGVAFLPVVLWRILAGNVGLRGALFFALLLVLHYATDSRRFHSTVGDWVGWRLMPPEARADEVTTVAVQHLDLPDGLASGPHIVTTRPTPESMRHKRVPPNPTPESMRHKRVPPNPWAPIPLMIDQSLHVVQIALLAGFLL